MRLAALLAILVTSALAGWARAGEERIVDVAPDDVLEGTVVPALSLDSKRKYAGQRLIGRYAVLLDTDGRVLKVEAIKSIPEADEAVRGALEIAHYRAPHRMVRVVIPVTIAPSKDSLDPNAYELETQPARRTTRAMLVAPNETGIPSEVIQRYLGQHQTGEYLQYLDVDGTVTRTDVRRSIPGCDDWVRKQLETGVYHPLPDKRIKFVTSVDLTFPAPPRPQASGAPKYRAVPPSYLQRLTGSDPKLPDRVLARAVGQLLSGTYMVYVDAGGHVARVDPVVSIPDGDAQVAETLKGWTFKPVGEPVRAMMQFTFSARR